MSNDSILIRRNGAAWSQPAVGTYDDEAHLQRILYDDPTRVPGVAAGSLGLTEVPTLGGYIDVCIVGRDGTLTVVECKLATNSEKRRMVIGQVQDYASSIWAAGAEAFHRAWMGRGGADLRTLLEPEAVSQLEANIADAKINLCVAVDLIDADLRRLIEYLNHATRPDITVTALQLAYARLDDVEILVPTTFGGEIAAAKARGTGQPSEQWTRERFLAAIVDDHERQVVQQLIDAVEKVDERLGGHEPVRYGKRPDGGVTLHPYGLRYAPVQLWVNIRGQAVLFGLWRWYTTITGHPGFAPLAELLGQNYLGAQRTTGVPIGNPDLAVLLPAILQTARAINEPMPSNPL